MGFELELENVVLVDAICLLGDAHTVAQQWETGQGVVILQVSTGMGGKAITLSPPLPTKWLPGGTQMRGP